MIAKVTFETLDWRAHAAWKLQDLAWASCHTFEELPTNKIEAGKEFDDFGIKSRRRGDAEISTFCCFSEISSNKIL